MLRVINNPKINDFIRNLAINYINLIIFQRNYLSRITRYDI